MLIESRFLVWSKKLESYEQGRLTIEAKVGIHLTHARSDGVTSQSGFLGEAFSAKCQK